MTDVHRTIAPETQYMGITLPLLLLPGGLSPVFIPIPQASPGTLQQVQGLLHIQPVLNKEKCGHHLPGYGKDICEIGGHYPRFQILFHN